MTTGGLLMMTVAVSLATSNIVRADTNTAPSSPSGYNELEDAARSLQPRPSQDETKIDFSVGEVRYRVPRNYLVTMDSWNGGPQDLVTVRINFPDLEPLTDRKRICFSAVPANRPIGCEPLTVTINAPGNFTADDAFARIRHLFHSQVPASGPDGFEKYELGPEPAGVEYYRKVEGSRIVLYKCQIFMNHGVRDGVCDSVGDQLTTGSVLHFYFPLRLLPQIAEFDQALRTLVENFSVGKSGAAQSPSQ
jgi:hypothetical protein